MNNFLPNDYVAPTQNNYMKLKQGENTFRAISSCIVGYEYWTNEEKSKPTRSKTPFVGIPSNIRRDNNNNPQTIKHFWAFVVWNYNIKAIQILEITQSTIQASIKALIDNKKWGLPQGYDITKTREGEGLDTDYTVMPNPHSEIDQNILDKYYSKKINLEALYTNENPFSDIVD